jgi:hypothetical protein
MMMAAVSTFGAVDFSRRLAGIPRLLRGAGSVACIVVFLRLTLNSVSRIRHQSHVVFFSYLSWTFYAALIPQQLLSNIEQAKKNYHPAIREVP